MPIAEKKYVMIRGGLGNQMSQFAFYLSLRQEFGNIVKPLNMCDSKGSKQLQIKRLFKDVSDDFISSKLLYILIKIIGSQRFSLISSKIQHFLDIIGITCVNEKYDYTFRPEILKTTGSKLTLYLGGWHCENYFKIVRSKVRKLYKFNLDSLDSKNKSLLGVIKKTESVAIHIRRGDYYTVGSKLLGGVCNFNYYSKALSIISAKVNSPTYFIFSDDPQWVKKNYKLDGFYIKGNSGENSWKDMLLMSSCKHNIICNSTFSWWGAWLNTNRNKIIICPNIFIASEKETEVYPETWLRIIL